MLSESASVFLLIKLIPVCSGVSWVNRLFFPEQEKSRITNGIAIRRNGKLLLRLWLLLNPIKWKRISGASAKINNSTVNQGQNIELPELTQSMIKLSNINCIMICTNFGAPHNIRGCLY